MIDKLTKAQKAQLMGKQVAGVPMGIIKNAADKARENAKEKGLLPKDYEHRSGVWVGLEGLDKESAAKKSFDNHPGYWKGYEKGQNLRKQGYANWPPEKRPSDPDYNKDPDFAFRK